MNKRQWFLMAGTIVLAACSGPITGVCETPGVSHGENRGRDQAGYVECETTAPADRPTAPSPTVNP